MYQGRLIKPAFFCVIKEDPVGPCRAWLAAVGCNVRAHLPV